MRHRCTVFGLAVSLLALLGSIAFAEGEFGSANLTTQVSKDGVRLEINAQLVFGDKQQNDDVWRIYQSVYRELLRNGWRNDSSGRYAGTIEFLHEARMKGTVTKVQIRIREQCLDPLFNTIKAERGTWEEQVVRRVESCVVDSGYWK